MNLLNIVTPCSRPENLEKIYESINIPKENYRWIVVFDLDTIPFKLPPTVEPHLYRHKDSIVGNGQRNYALSLIDTGHIIFLDDDTLLHPNIWEEIKDLSDDFIHYAQEDKGKLRVTGIEIKVDRIDMGQFVVNRNIVKDHKFPLKLYQADGVFAMLVSSETNNKRYIPKVLSYYNQLK
jgi:hypothetical protein